MRTNAFPPRLLLHTTISHLSFARLFMRCRDYDDAAADRCQVWGRLTSHAAPTTKILANTVNGDDVIPHFAIVHINTIEHSTCIYLQPRYPHLSKVNVSRLAPLPSAISLLSSTTKHQPCLSSAPAVRLLLLPRLPPPQLQHASRRCSRAVAATRLTLTANTTAHTTVHTTALTPLTQHILLPPSGRLACLVALQVTHQSTPHSSPSCRRRLPSETLIAPSSPQRTP